MSAFTKQVFALAGILTLVSAVSASAQVRRGAVVVVPRTTVVRPFFYDPFWGPWPYGYAYYPYALRATSRRT